MLFRSIDLKPAYAESYVNLGLALKGKGRMDDAIDMFEHAIELKPNLANAQRGLNLMAQLLATSNDVSVRNPKKAVDLAQQLCKRTPTSGDFWNTLGVASYRAGDWQGAIAALEKSVNLRNGGDGHDHYYLAMAHGRLDHKAEAQKWFERAVQGMEQNPSRNHQMQQLRNEAELLLGLKK